eukprot:TRINITY_DN7059_c0_g1_i1.p1 TRINITY_DN7059_c0_g1~~TRINITY_DN7059_c0_g1_i1.p1  ORF type:complete len:438 (+),score=96.03 TRINITY_DN7059_c0_g1_i1:59-1372(+)
MLSKHILSGSSILNTRHTLRQKLRHSYKRSYVVDIDSIDTSPRTVSSVIVSLKDKPGTLMEVLESFRNNDINITNIASRTTYGSFASSIHIKFSKDLDDAGVGNMMEDLRKKALFVQPMESYTVPFYPKSLEELEIGRKNCIMSGELEADHPGFNDEEYKQRRNEIALIAENWSYGDPIPNVEYTEKEIECWKHVFDQLMKLFPTHPCSQYQTIFPLLIENCGMHRDNIPQLSDISNFLKSRTGFTIAPVSGLLSSRDFLNALAFRSFSSTQYVRHHSNPMYTPEPDIVHDIIGHIPLLADPDFADFSQSIGLASLGASDEDLEKLARCYWFTIEFGLLKQEGRRRAVGAGLLSSFGELQYCLSDKPQVKRFDPWVASKQDYPITEYQPLYFEADSFKQMTKQLQEFSKTLQRPFDVKYNPYTQVVTEVSKENIFSM